VAKERRHRNQPKLKKEHCEVCFETKKSTLNIHHIIPQCDERSSNNNYNLAVLCANCHNLVHSGDITIIGVYSSTNNNGRSVLFFRKGEKPPLEEIYWRVKDNNKVITK
jgi:predicted HNH restriction endonuclease